MLRILCQSDYALIIIEDNNRLKSIDKANLTKQIAKSNSFFDDLSLIDILYLTDK